MLRHQQAVYQAQQEQAQLQQAQQLASEAGQARALLQQVAEQVQQQAHSQIASVVTRCLQVVFEDSAPGFTITFEQKRGRTEARLCFVTQEGHTIDPTEEGAGGWVDVASFALRLAALCLSKPPLRKLLVADEPFKHLSRAYRPRVRDLLLLLASELGVQIVMVTHAHELECGKVVRLS